MSTPSNRRLTTLALGAVPIVLLGGLMSIDHIPGTDISLTVPYAAQGPGPTVDTLSNVDGLDVVEIEGAETYETSGQLNMTTVAVRTNMSLSQAIGRWLTTDDTIVPLETVIPTGTSSEDMQEANQQAFVQSEAAATVTAMDYLDIPVHVVVAGVMEESAAFDFVKLEDVVLAVDGQDVSEPAEVQELIRAKAPGDEVTLTLENNGEEREETVTLGEHPDDASVPLLGVTMTSAPRDGMNVTYNLQDVGGPSAGMMFSLAVIDKLTEEDLTGGHFVAGTGTISEDGTVGPIGGIEHKIEASKEAGAELFLAPAANCEAATSRDAGDMVIASVETLDDAVQAMDDFANGGEVRTCSG
ncbi:PDZ domain-containing protein [Corynebacteriaceae bacterium 6-324]